MPGPTEERRSKERRKKKRVAPRQPNAARPNAASARSPRTSSSCAAAPASRSKKGAVTTSYAIDPKVVVGILNEALATEIVCVLRYKRHYFMATGIHAQTVAAEFLEHANEEQTHADQIAERITQLGGEPNFDPKGLATRSHSEYVAGGSLVDMIREDLVAERIAIESYSEIVRFLGDKDITTRRMMEGILAMEEEHADDLMNLLTTLDPSKKG